MGMLSTFQQSQEFHLSCLLTCAQANWPFHRSFCRHNDFADALSETDPKFSAWMRKHHKQAVLKVGTQQLYGLRALCLCSLSRLTEHDALFRKGHHSAYFSTPPHSLDAIVSSSGNEWYCDELSHLTGKTLVSNTNIPLFVSSRVCLSDGGCRFQTDEHTLELRRGQRCHHVDALLRT